MLQGLFGNDTVEDVLYFLQVNSEGNATQISKTTDIALSMVQKQLKRLEDGGIRLLSPTFCVMDGSGRTPVASLNKLFCTVSNEPIIVSISLRF